MTDDEREKIPGPNLNNRGHSADLDPVIDPASDDSPPMGVDVGGETYAAARDDAAFAQRPTGDTVTFTGHFDDKLDALFKPFHEDDTITLRLMGVPETATNQSIATITGRVIREEFNPDLVRAQKQYDHYAAVDVEITKIMLIDFRPIEERLLRHYRKLRGRKKYLKRYHRIGAMIHRRGRKGNRVLPVKPGQYAKHRGDWGYVVAVDDKTVMLSGWRWVKTRVIRRTQVEAVKDKL